MSRSNFTKKIVYAAGRAVGEVRGDTFYKTIAHNHYLRVPPAIAFDYQSLLDAQGAGAIYACVTDRETGVQYRSTIEHILEKGREFDRGYGRQVFLPLEAWTTTKRGGGLQLALAGLGQ